LLRIYETKSNPKKIKNKEFFGCSKLPACQMNFVFGALFLN
jgi:hypothetical protein